MCDLSIIIPVLNNFTYTINTLNSLSYLDINYNIEVIIIDNGSTDETPNQLPFFNKIKNFYYIRNDENKGFAFAINQGWTKSTGKNVMMLNNDIKIIDKEHWIDPILDELKLNPYKLISPTGGMVHPITFEFQYETKDNKKEFNYLSGWCLTSDRNTWLALTTGGLSYILDQETFFVFFEDTDLSFRAAKIGVELKIVPIEVSHFEHKTAKLLNLQSLYQDGKKRFIKKWKKK